MRERHLFRLMAAALLRRAVVRVTEIILAIIGILLEALRAFWACLFKWIPESATTRPRPTSPPVRRRRAFDNHPPSAWAAP